MSSAGVSIAPSTSYPPPPAAGAEPLGATMGTMHPTVLQAELYASSPVGSWRPEQLKANAGFDSLLMDRKMTAQDVVDVDAAEERVDRGSPAAHAIADAALMGTWQHKVSGGKLPVAKALADMKTEKIAHGGVMGVQAHVNQLIQQHQLEDTFYVVDLGNVQRMFRAWRAAMPRIVPFYAVKCHPDAGMLRMLSAMGSGFDCASRGEIEMVLKMGVDPSRIIFAHTTKRASDIRYARDNGVQYTTFDSESELHKMAMLAPRMNLVLRIRADDPDARVPLGLKYGAEVIEAPKLLEVARSLGLNVAGVSFHVGSACGNVSVYSDAIQSARRVFDAAIELGFDMKLLDIGGGFTGAFDSHGNVVFAEIANTINAAVAEHFPADTGVRVIAEPGRYFAETASTLMTPVYGHRDRTSPEGALLRKDYWLTDGLYGSFNCILYDGQNPNYRVLRSPLLTAPTAAEEDARFNSTLWGPTCDSADIIYKDQMLPQLRNGDWLQFYNAGAYTVAGACDFNGIEFTQPNRFYIFSESAVDAVPEADAAEEVAMAM